MNKRRLHHLWTRIRRVKPLYFLIIALVSGVICVFALRANNEHMVKLRAAVYAADTNNTDIQKPLQALQRYVTRHMNTSLTAGNTGIYPPIQLKNTYDRLVKAQSAQASQGNTQLYTDAQTYCQAQNSTDFSGHNRVPCIEQYVQSHTGVNAPVTSQIPDSLYKFSFASPSWSPDLAGWSLLAAILSGALFVIVLVADRWIYRHSR